jgi:hypothetical protein
VLPAPDLIKRTLARTRSDTLSNHQPPPINDRYTQAGGGSTAMSGLKYEITILDTFGTPA